MAATFIHALITLILLSLVLVILDLVSLLTGLGAFLHSILLRFLL